MVVVPERIVEACRFVVFGSPFARPDPAVLAEPLATFTHLNVISRLGLHLSKQKHLMVQE